MKLATNEVVQGILDRLPDDAIDAWIEKASVMEFDAGYSRPQAEALALIDLLDNDPELISELTVARVNIDTTTRYFAASGEDLLREHAELLGGTIASRQGIAWTIDHEFGSIVELVAV